MAWREEIDPTAALDERITAEIPRLRGFLGKLNGRRTADLDDLVQESLARALRYRESFDGRRALWPWLKRTAFRVFLDQRNAARFDVEEGVAEAPARDDDGLAQREEVHRLLAALPAIEREVLTRFHQAGCSVREIAAELGAPEGTIKSHLYRARRRLAARGRLPSRGEGETGR